MNLEVSRKDLSDAIALAASASNNRTALPILQTLRLEAKDSVLTVTGCDGELWAKRSVVANVREPGAVCVNATFLRQLVSALPEGPLDLQLEGTSLFVRRGAAEWRLMALPATDYPEAPPVQSQSELRLQMGELREAVDSVSFAVSDDSSRPYLTGVLFNYDGQVLTLVATDTHRLSVLRLERPGIGSSNLNAIVPAKTLNAIKGLPITDTEEVVVRFDETRLNVEAGAASVTSQLLSGTYPNWERVVPSESTRTWTFDRTELIDHVKRLRILAAGNANRVRFLGHGEQVQISARSEDMGEAKEEIAVVAKNGEIQIAFNGEYVQEALAALKSDGIRLEMTEPARPAIFRPVDGGEKHFCVIMPMAIS